MKNNKGKHSVYPFIDDNGYLWVTARVTRLGVMPYSNEDKMGIHQELKCEKELFDKVTIDSFYGIPITVEHPYEGEVTPENIKCLSVGTTMSVPIIDEGHYLKSRLLIIDQDVIKDVMKRQQKGNSYEVSCGYSAELDWNGGKWNGINYDAVQRKIRFNHLALVSEGRAGPQVKLQI